MKLFFIALASLIGFASCTGLKQLEYSFDATDVADSIGATLVRSPIAKGVDFSKIKWFALIRQKDKGYEVIINEEFGGKDSPIVKIVEKSNRFLLLGQALKIPVVFESDLLSEEFRNVGSINWGGYYFNIQRENGQFKIVDKAVLF